MPSKPGCFSRFALVNTASLPMATPCSLAPISAPQIQYGLASNTAWVRGTWGISMCVALSTSVGCSAAGMSANSWASLGSRSLFLARITDPSAVASGRLTKVSHTGPLCARQAVCVRTTGVAPPVTVPIGVRLISESGY